MNKYTFKDPYFKYIKDDTQDEMNTNGVYFKGKFISYELIDLIKSKY